MPRIVIVSSFTLFKLYLKKNFQESDENKCIIFSSVSSKQQKLLDQHQITESEKKRSHEVQDDVIADYREIIDQLGEWNGEMLHWWASDIASRNRYISPLAILLTDLTCVIEGMKHLKKDITLYLLYPSWPIISMIRKYAEIKAIKINMLCWPLTKYFLYHINSIKEWKESIIQMAKLIKKIWYARTYFPEMVHLNSKNQQVYLIKSFIALSDFNSNGLFQDRIFEKLKLHLTSKLNKNKKTLTVVSYDGYSSAGPSYNKLREEEGVLPIERFLSYSEFWRGIFDYIKIKIFQKFRVKGQMSLLGFDVTIFFSELFKLSGGKISFTQYIYYIIGKNIRKQYKIIGCYLTHENNPWERMFIAGLRFQSPAPIIYGYQHTVVPQSAVGVFGGYQDLESNTYPDHILTTGLIPLNIIRKYSNFPKNYIQATCALRYSYLQKMQTLSLQEKSSPFRVLVALEGVPEVDSLVNYSLKQANLNPDNEFKFRSHILSPIESILSSKDQIGITSNILLSKNTTLLEDLETCDAVLYWGTTVSLEAIMIGKPIIHFDRGDVLSYDPLFELENFKWKVSKEQDLRPILNEIQNLSEQEYEQQQIKASEYVKTYFSPITNESMSLFLVDC